MLEQKNTSPRDPEDRRAINKKSRTNSYKNNTAVASRSQEEGDRAAISNMLQYLFYPGDVFEICFIAPKIKKSPLWGNEFAGGKSIIAGWFNDIKTATDTIVKADGVKPVATYVTLNPCTPALLGRANNKLKAGVNRTKDTEIAEIRHMLVDVDPKRPAGISSTDAEKEAAMTLLRTVYSDLKTLGWPEPLVGDSGNGGHLIYPVDTDCAGLVPDFLKALDRKYSTPTVNIDTTVGNPARLVKVYGTWTRKGDSTADRPHRRAEILSYPGEVDR